MAKMALITGASSGIGEATASLLSQKGYKLILTGRRKDRLEKLARKLKAEFWVFDISNEKDIATVCKKNQKLLSKVDILVNNAGLARGSDKVQDAKVEDFNEMIDTNIKGLFSLTQKILPLMLKNGEGHIVNIGSVSGRWVYPGGAVYCATKHAVRAFSEGLRMDLLGQNIRVTNIEPGMANTEFSTVRFRSKEKAATVYQGMTPLSAKDVAETIVWSLERPAHVNIQELVVYPTDQAHVSMVHRAKGTK